MITAITCPDCQGKGTNSDESAMCPTCEGAGQIAAGAAQMMNLIHSGFAGVEPDGKIVDRREHSKATPLQQNTLLGVPKPQKLIISRGKGD